MKRQLLQKKQLNIKVTVEDVNRVLEVGRLLLSVLTPEEIEELTRLSGNKIHHAAARDVNQVQISNTGIS